MTRTYTKDDIIRSFKNIGLKKGDIVFCHSNLGFSGKLIGAKNIDDYCKIYLNAFKEVIGEEGTLVVPTFSYSFFNNEKYILKESPSRVGSFSEYIRKLDDSHRSMDPNFSVASIGKLSKILTSDLSNHPFGKNSFFDRFLNYKGKICNINFDSGSTFIHYVEKSLNVPYRYDKPFHGTIVENGIERNVTYYHYVYDLRKPGDKADFSKFHKYCIKNRITRSDKLGRGEVILITAQETYDIIEQALKNNPSFLKVD